MRWLKKILDTIRDVKAHFVIAESREVQEASCKILDEAIKNAQLNGEDSWFIQQWEESKIRINNNNNSCVYKEKKHFNKIVKNNV